MEKYQREISTNLECYEGAPKDYLDEMIKFRSEYKINILKDVSGKIEYIKKGNAKRTVLLFHGALGSADTPYVEIERLSKDYTVLSPTIRDFKDLDDMNNWINKMLDYEKIDEVIIRGGSFGSFIAQIFFHRNLDKIKGLFLVNGIPPKGKYSKMDRFSVLLFKIFFRLFPEGIVKRIIAKDLNKLTDTSFNLTMEQEKELEFLKCQLCERINNAKKKDILEAFQIAVDYDLKEKYNESNINKWNGTIYLITDTKDSSYKYFEIFKKLYNTPHTKIFKDAGHMLQMIYKDEFQQEFNNFLLEIS